MDIANKSELHKYLVEKGWVTPANDCKCQVLSGGVSATTVLVTGTRQSMVIKQGLSKLKTKADWFSDPDRLRIESMGLQWMNEHLASRSAPRFLFYDHKYFLLGMEAITDPHQNFKEVLIQGNQPVHLIRKMGGLLGRIHHLGLKDQEAMEVFEDRSYFINLRIEPYYEYSKECVPETSAFFDELIKDTLHVQDTLVHGDFSPKNILIKDDQLILLDFEVMHFGDPAFDVGFMLCHLLSKANFHQSEAFVEMAKELWKYYRHEFQYDKDGFELRCVRHLLGCLIARVHGRSPLEYLSKDQQQWQSGTALKLIAMERLGVASFLTQYKKELNERNDN